MRPKGIPLSSGINKANTSPARAEELRQANLQLLLEPTSRFAEYLEPYTGEPLGSMDQSWTAAVALDWLARDHVRGYTDLATRPERH